MGRMRIVSLEHDPESSDEGFPSFRVHGTVDEKPFEVLVGISLSDTEADHRPVSGVDLADDKDVGDFLAEIYEKIYETDIYKSLSS